MKRRSFLTLSTLSALPAAVHADGKPDQEPDWFPTIRYEDLTFKAIAPEADITLQVELFRLPDAEITESLDADGKTVFKHHGKVLPHPYKRGSTLIRRFDLTWEGKPIKIPDRFWNDLAGFRIETSTLKPDSLDPDLRWKAIDFLNALRQPHLTLSADGGTVLIRWERPEESGSPDTVRWMVARSGTVLRHREQPPHEC